MNHKNEMPANGTRFNARATVFELVLSHIRASSGSARTENRKSVRPAISKIEKRMPATAAARGVFKSFRISVTSFFIFWQSETIERIADYASIVACNTQIVEKFDWLDQPDQSIKSQWSSTHRRTLSD